MRPSSTVTMFGQDVAAQGAPLVVHANRSAATHAEPDSPREIQVELTLEINSLTSRLNLRRAVDLSLNADQLSSLRERMLVIAGLPGAALGSVLFDN